MSGYKGYSMSNNAVQAYNNGERPLSKWTKSDIISAVKTAVSDGTITITYKADDLKQLRVSVLRNVSLKRSSWHHTSSHYNRTDFYALDYSALERLTLDDIKDIADVKEEKPTVKEETAFCEFLVWGGTRKHPKATKCQAEGTIKGNWFYLPDGSKKSITANGFRIISKTESN